MCIVQSGQIMWVYMVVFLCLGYFSLVNGFNLDTEHPIIFENPEKNNIGNRSNYFGFTTALVYMKGDSPWIFVGAPRGNSSTEKQKNINEPGVVYQCEPLNPDGTCTQITLDKTGNNKHSFSKNTNHSYTDRKDGAWIGGAMDVRIDDNYSDMTVCGHRWINNINVSHYFMTGVCYSVTQNIGRGSPIDVTKLLPLVDAERVEKNGTYFFGQGQAGISAHFPLKTDKLLLGGPGVNNWRGSFITYKNSSKENRTTDNVLVAHAEVAPFKPLSLNYDYAGYQVTSGRFFKDKCLYYAIGAPRADYKGKVFIIKNDSQCTDKLEHYTKEIPGEVLGEYFGASLAVADVNNDTLDDLIVGAPTSGNDDGRIYVYHGYNNILKKEENVSRTGKIARARFGMTIASLGDLDKDGYDDIVVGAPFEDGKRGAIYIYNGGPTGLSKDYSQYIKAESFRKNFKGFGISFSRPTDIDNNNYQDIAVGSFISGHAVILRACPVVTINMTLTSKVTFIQQNTTSFTLQSCTYVKINGGKVKPVDVSQKFYVDHRIKSLEPTDKLTIAGKGIYERNVTVEDNYCEDFEVYLNGTLDSSTDPITIRVHYSLIGLSKRDFNGVNEISPIENRPLNKFTDIKILFVEDCGSDNMCYSDLKLVCKFEHVSENGSYIIDSNKPLQLKIDVFNNGPHIAYETRVKIHYSNHISIDRKLIGCEDERSANTLWKCLSCKIKNELKVNEAAPHTESVYFNVKDVIDVTKPIEFKVEAVSKSNDTNIYNSNWNFTVHLITEAGVSITGKSEDPTTPDDRSIMSFSHTYTVQKFGKSPISEAEVILTIPQFFEGQQILNISEIKATKDGQITCSSTNVTFEIVVAPDEESEMEALRSDTEFYSDDFKEKPVVLAIVDNEVLKKAPSAIIHCNESTPFSCVTIRCTTRSFPTTQTTADIPLKMRINYTQIESLFGKKDIQISTSGHVHITHPEEVFSPSEILQNSVQVTTLIPDIKPPIKVANSIIIIGVVVGILVLAIVIFILFKVGFFRRKKKEELNNLKRQTTTQEQNGMELQDTPRDNSSEVTPCENSSEMTPHDNSCDVNQEGGIQNIGYEHTETD